MTDEEAEASREQIRGAIYGAFCSLAEEDKGLPAHMAMAYVGYYLNADHDELDIQQQLTIVSLIHRTILQMLHLDPSSLQMAHAHAYVHSLFDTYVVPSEEGHDEDDEQPDTLLEESQEDLEQWAAELEQFMKEQEVDNGEGDAGPSTEDTGTD